jgi:hypothetical protein
VSRGFSFEQFDERLTGRKAGNGRSVGIVEWFLGKLEDVAIERQDLIEGPHRDTDVREAGSATGWWNAHGASQRENVGEAREVNPIPGRAKPTAGGLLKCRTQWQ